MSDRRPGAPTDCGAYRRSLILLLILGANIGQASAQAQSPVKERWPAEQPRAPAKSPQTNQAPAPQAAVTAPNPSVPIEQALYLIRSALLTLNDANRSGNYSVLRDLAAPDFRVKNTAADLAQSFSDLRQRRFDLFAVALLAPVLTAAPTVNGNILRLTGSVPTRPLAINFDLAFQRVGNEWLLFGISVATPQAAPLAQTSPAPAQ